MAVFAPPKVYPHVCGAAAVGRDRQRQRKGLSPRVWGSPAHTADPEKPYRSIPTCVGQPVTSPPYNLGKAVYPHVCGAAMMTEEQGVPVEGLSPRVWGSRDGSHRDTVEKRSIPTCVGQPIGHHVREYGTQVYPHVCGAASQLHHLDRSHLGLSPRVWGSQDLQPFASALSGSIPTCVGQPASLFLCFRVFWVYPHVCGAACTNRSRHRMSEGLSPRVWGSRARLDFWPSARRSIPTCVGQPED